MAIKWRSKAPRPTAGDVFLPRPGVERLIVWSGGDEEWVGPMRDLNDACGSPVMHRRYLPPTPARQYRRPRVWVWLLVADVGDSGLGGVPRLWRCQHAVAVNGTPLPKCGNQFRG